MKRLFIALALLLVQLPMVAQVDSASADTVRHQVLLHTTKGDIVVELYNGTPRHRDNFLRLVKSGYYNGILWHRVIADFMIQTGDSTTRHAKPGEQVGEYDVDYTVPAEIRFPQLFHKRGALAAARQGDDVNPQRASSGAQFYIVWGYPFTTAALNRVQEKLDERTDGKIKLTPAIREYYMSYGGTPHLDGQYTVFGQVVKGLDVVGAIDYVKTDEFDRPEDDVRILKAVVLK